MSKSVKSVSRSVSSDMTDKKTKKSTKKKVEEVVEVPEDDVAPTPPKKSTKKKTAASVEDDAAPPPPKKTTKKGKKDKVEEETVPVEDVPPASEDNDAEVPAAAAEEKKRREVSHESVALEFDALMELLRENIESSRSGDKKKASNVKLLRQLGKRLKVLKTDCLKISKQKRVNRKKNTTSGFMKPVCISDDMAKFAGWDPTQLRSRNDATKFICDYIKTHNLQNPSDRRQINPDDKLCRLLSYDSKNDKPLTYYSIQQKMQPHFKNPSA